MSADGPSFLNMFETENKKKPQPYPEDRAPAVVAARERDKAWEERGKAVKVKAHLAAPAVINKYVAEHYTPEQKADEYNRAVQLGMSESEKIKMRETQAEVNRREAARVAGKAGKAEKAGEVEVNLEEESVSVTFTLDQGYIDAIKLPDTYFNIITSVKTS